MIFSTDLCPICSQKLQLEIVEGNKSVLLKYACENKGIIRSSPTIGRQMSHYTNDCFSNGQVAMMIMPPFLLIHREAEGKTDVFSSEHFDHNKIIFKSKLLDLDYSQPHVVLTKLKLLVTFS